MKTAVLTPQGFIFKEEKTPSCKPWEVLVKSAGCGICEGDVFHYLNRGKAGRNDGTDMRLGHEGSGVVAEVGSQVEGFKPGDRVTALGGDYAEYFITTPGCLALLPDSIQASSGLGEPIACCIAAAPRFGIRLGDRVAIIGAGYMGQTCLQLARLLGAAECVSLDLLDWRLAVARRSGADRTINTTGKTPASLLAELGVFDVVVEATGVQAAVDIATALVREHGTFSLVGYHQSGEGMRHVDMKLWNYKAINVVNAHIRDQDAKLRDMKAGLRLVAGGRLDSRAFVTDYPFADISRAFEDLASRKEGLFKGNLVF